MNKNIDTKCVSDEKFVCRAPRLNSCLFSKTVISEKAILCPSFFCPGPAAFSLRDGCHKQAVRHFVVAGKSEAQVGTSDDHCEPAVVSSALSGRKPRE